MRFGVISLALAGALAMAVAGGTIAGTNPDTDADGVFDVVDNCLEDANPPMVGTNLTDLQTDYDRDGFGNTCDSDFNNSGTVNGTDFGFFFGCFNISPIDQAPSGVNCQNMDYNDTGTVNGTDFGFFFGDFISTILGPSNLACALTAGGSPNLTGRSACEFDPTPND